MSTRRTEKRLGAAGARRYWLIWFFVAPLVAWALIRDFGLDRGFPLAPLMAFTPYAAVAALLVAGVALALRNWAAAGVAGLVTLCLAAAVLPRAIGDGTVDPEGRETFTVLSDQHPPRQRRPRRAWSRWSNATTPTCSASRS